MYLETPNSDAEIMEAEKEVGIFHQRQKMGMKGGKI